jgi:hypothetical protein
MAGAPNLSCAAYWARQAQKHATELNNKWASTPVYLPTFDEMKSRKWAEPKAPTFCFPCIDLGKIKGKGFKPFINRLELFIKGIFWGHEINRSLTKWLLGCARI